MKEETKSAILGKGKCELIAFMRIFGKGKCKLIANFSATMVTSFQSLSLSKSDLFHHPKQKEKYRHRKMRRQNRQADWTSG